MDQGNLDKLDCKITAEFWERKNAVWREQERQVQICVCAAQQVDEPARLLTASPTLELANKAFS